MQSRYPVRNLTAYRGCQKEKHSFSKSRFRAVSRRNRSCRRVPETRGGGMLKLTAAKIPTATLIIVSIDRPSGRLIGHPPPKGGMTGIPRDALQRAKYSPFETNLRQVRRI